MKYLFKTLLIFLGVFLSLKFFLFLTDNSHDVSYNVGNFKIEETWKDDIYYFVISGEKVKINFQINKDYNKAEKIIKKIKYKKIDGYNCFLPIFKNNENLTDVMCLKDSVIMYGHNLNIDKIDNYFNIKNTYKDKASGIKVSNTQTLYKDNLVKNHYIAMESYKGLDLYNGNKSNVKIFENDVYKKPISYFTDKYYIVADYTAEYTFKNFYLVNIINGNITNIRSYDEISFDSYMEGTLNNDFYLFDKDASKQYKISIKNESVELFASKNNLKTYNGKWESISLSDALNGKTFNNYYVNVKGYDKADKVDNYYYLYEKDDNHYNVYRADIQNKKIKTYLFETTNLNSIIYLDDYIYYQNGNTYYYYGNNGVRKVLTNTELEFNSDLSLWVYEEK